MHRHSSLTLSILLGLSLFTACKPRTFSDEAGVSQSGGSSTAAATSLLGDPTQSIVIRLGESNEEILERTFREVVGVEAARHVGRQGFVIGGDAYNSVRIPEGNGPITVRWILTSQEGPARTVTLNRTIPRSHPCLAAAFQDPNIRAVWKIAYITQAVVADLGEAVQNDVASSGELTQAKAIPEKIATAAAPEAVVVRNLASQAAAGSWADRWSMAEESRVALAEMSPELRRFLVSELTPESVGQRVGKTDPSSVNSALLEELARYRDMLEKSSASTADLRNLGRVMNELARRTVVK